MNLNLKYFKAPIDDLASTSQGQCNFCNSKDTLVFKLQGSKTGCVDCLKKKLFKLGGQLVLGGWYKNGKHYFFCADKMAEVLSKPQPNITKEAIEALDYTPCYKDQQGYSVWPVCCRVFPTYTGKWKPQDFLQNGGKELFSELIDEEYLWDQTFSEENPKDWANEANIYMFKCENCDSYKAYWDCT